ncbi:DMT family transporter [Pseudomonas sp. R76]|uniref:DMT family transporter n=1 Tax=Pseudomonas sp. R76 TaxID=1573711 RepID=UPI00131F973D|nr:DMT family transporter [Pseudomonas sp. R76]QHD05339.1 EamA family transporter [Pseudomonas sp. R76]
MQAQNEPSSTAYRSRIHKGAATIVWLCVMVLLWGISWPVTKLALTEVAPIWLSAFRFGSASVCLFVFVALRGKLKFPPRADWPIVISIGLLQMTVFTGLGMVAMTHVDTSRATLLAYTTPLWGLISGWVLQKIQPTRIQLIALALGMIGIGVICSPMEMNWSTPGAVMGACFLITGAIAWSVAILHIKSHKWQASPLQLAPWQMALATIPLTIAAYTIEGVPNNVEVNSRLLELLFFIGPIATSACFVISAEHGRRISTFAMSNFTLGVPLIGITASVIFLSERLSLWFSIGLSFILAGMLMTILAASRQGRTTMKTKT